MVSSRSEWFLEINCHLYEIQGGFNMSRSTTRHFLRLDTAVRKPFFFRDLIPDLRISGFPESLWYVMNKRYCVQTWYDSQDNQNGSLKEGSNLDLRMVKTNN